MITAATVIATTIGPAAVITTAVRAATVIATTATATVETAATPASAVETTSTAATTVATATAMLGEDVCGQAHEGERSNTGKKSVKPGGFHIQHPLHLAIALPLGGRSPQSYSIRTP
jgi:hypothetical protein